MIIEKNVPMPAPGKRTDKHPFAERKYTFNEMEVGDSAFFAGSSTLGAEYQSAKLLGKRHGKKFAGRNVEGGLRIWRTE